MEAPFVMQLAPDELERLLTEAAERGARRALSAQAAQMEAITEAAAPLTRKYITTKAYAKIAGVSPAAVRKWCRERKVDAVQRGSRWYVRHQSDVIPAADAELA